MSDNNDTSQKLGTVLVIEDELFLVEAYRMKFAKEGVNAQFVTNGAEAVALLTKQGPPSVILLDLLLPEVSGFEVLGAIRKNDQWKDVPVLILSNLSQVKDIERCKELGVVEFIVKANTKINDIVEKVKPYV
jgi:CheY-like chemotaxis protein